MKKVIIIYLIGCVFAYPSWKHGKSHIKSDWTNGDRVEALIFSSFSWATIFACGMVEISEIGKHSDYFNKPASW